MDKRTYFLKAMHSGAFKEKHWAFSAFSTTYDNETTLAKYKYPYRLFWKEDGYYFIDPENTVDGLTLLEGVDTTQPPFKFKDSIRLKAGDVPNLKEDVVTTFGNVLVNFLCLVYPFGEKIAFMTGEIKIPKIEREIEERLESDVGENEQEDPSKIYVHEYLKYAEAAFFLESLNPISVPSASPKTMTRDPRIPEIRAKELAANKDRLHDPAVVARIDKKLEEIDRAWVDDWGKRFYIKDKAYSNSRKKLFSMYGFEKGFVEGMDSTLITKSLSEGWDYNNLPAIFNSSREGSFNRGALTMLGGVAVKEAFRALQNSRIAEHDCGTTLGIARFISSDGHAKKFIGFYRVVGTKSVEITKENVNEIVGKQILLRSPMLCKTSHTDFCEVCMGKPNARNPTGLGASGADVGSGFMGTFMKKMHVSSLKIAEFDHVLSIT